MQTRDCERCGAKLRLIRTPRGKAVWCDFEEVEGCELPDGMQMVTKKGRFVQPRKEERGFVYHGDTCRGAK